MVAGELKPLSRRQRRHLEGVVHRAEATTGLQICVYIGPADEDSRAHAESMFQSAGLHTRPAVLVLVAPNVRRVEIVTAPDVKERISDDAAGRAVSAMTERFSRGELAHGLEAGVTALAEAAGPGEAPPDTEELPDLLGG